MAEVPINSVVNLNVPATVPDGFENPEVRSAVELFINSAQNLLRNIERYVGISAKDITLWDFLTPSDTLLKHQSGRLYVTAGEDITFGSFINLYNNAGILNARKANAAAGLVKPAHGYCSTGGGVATGSRGEVILSQGLLAISGLLPGQAIYLSAVAGLSSIAPAGGAGQLEQYLGIGVANDLAYINIAAGPYIQH